MGILLFPSHTGAQMWALHTTKCGTAHLLVPFINHTQLAFFLTHQAWHLRAWRLLVCLPGVFFLQRFTSLAPLPPLSLYSNLTLFYLAASTPSPSQHSLFPAFSPWNLLPSHRWYNLLIYFAYCLPLLDCEVHEDWGFVWFVYIPTTQTVPGIQKVLNKYLLNKWISRQISSSPHSCFFSNILSFLLMTW